MSAPKNISQGGSPLSNHNLKKRAAIARYLSQMNDPGYNRASNLYGFKECYLRTAG